MSTETTHVRRALGEILTALRALSGIISQRALVDIPEYDSLRRDGFVLTSALAEIEEQIGHLTPKSEPRPEIVTLPPEDPAPHPAYPTVEDLVDLLRLVDGYGAGEITRAKKILARFPKLPSPNDVRRVLCDGRPTHEVVTRLFALFAGESPLTETDIDPAPESRTTTPEPRTQVDASPYERARCLVWNFAASFEKLTPVSASLTLDSVMREVVALLRPEDPSPQTLLVDPVSETTEPRTETRHHPTDWREALVRVRDLANGATQENAMDALILIRHLSDQALVSSRR